MVILGGGWTYFKLDLCVGHVRTVKGSLCSIGVRLCCVCVAPAAGYQVTSADCISDLISVM